MNRKMKIIPVILAGGAGTRLWPLSREDKPKQFHNLSGEGTLLEETIRRLLPMSPETFVIVTAKKHEKASQQELDKLGVKGVVLAEPYPRNTAAAVLYAATYLSCGDSESIMVVLPADHYIRDQVTFRNILKKAVERAKLNKLVAIGITPTYPETGYGYIQAIQKGEDVCEVERFVEKPDIESARKYIEQGNFFWNSGIFVWKTAAILESFKQLMPDLYKAFEPLRKLTAGGLVSSEGSDWELKKEVFEHLRKESIDFGIMEKAENRLVIPGSFGWADLGSWYSIDGFSRRTETTIALPTKRMSFFLIQTAARLSPKTKELPS
jgi:mannose-1-phosphate guanylyltransferase